MVAELGSVPRTDPAPQLEISTPPFCAPDPKPSRDMMTDPAKRSSSEMASQRAVPDSPEEQPRKRAVSESRPRLSVRIDDSGPKTPDRAFDQAFTGHSPAGMPPLIGVNCSVTELREYTVKALAHQSTKLRELQRQVENDATMITRTNADLNEYARKHEIQALDGKAEGVNRKVDELDASLGGLRNQLNEVMGNVDQTMRRDQGYIDKIATVEKMFQEHVQEAFARAEKDLQNLNGLVHEINAERLQPRPAHGHGTHLGTSSTIPTYSPGSGPTGCGFPGLPTTTTSPAVMGPASTSNATGPYDALLTNVAGMKGQQLAGPPGFHVGGGLDLGAPGAPGDGAGQGGGAGAARAAGGDEPCRHCGHVDVLWAERAKIQHQATVMNVKLDSLAAALQLMAASAGPGAGGGAASGDGRVEDLRLLHGALDARVAQVEQYLKEQPHLSEVLRRVAALELQTAALSSKQQQPAPRSGRPQGSAGAVAAEGQPSFLSGGLFNPVAAGPAAEVDAGGDAEMFCGNGPVYVGTLNKLFDDKVAINPEYRYEGGDDGDHWLTKVRNYLVSKCTAMLPILKWAESLGDVVLTKEIIEAEEEKHEWLADATVIQVGGALWGFLNMALKKEALTCFKGAQTLNGLDAWRRIARHVRRGKNTRLDSLRKLVRNPPPIKKLEDVSVGIMHFENVINDYVAAGGMAPTQQEMKSDLLDSLPLEMRENLLYKTTKEDEPFSSFATFVNQTVHHILYHRGQYNKLPVSSVEEDRRAKMTEMEEMLGAMMKKAGYVPRGGSGSPGKPGREGREERSPKCPNCGSDKHAGRDCPEPRVPMEKRPCHQCGKPGHMARNCPSKRAAPGKPARLVDAEEPELESFGGCIMDVEEFQVVDRRRRGRPMPSTLKLQDFIAPVALRNAFDELRVQDEGEVMHGNANKSINQIKREKAKLRKKAEREQQGLPSEPTAAAAQAPPALPAPASESRPARTAPRRPPAKTARFCCPKACDCSEVSISCAKEEGDAEMQIENEPNAIRFGNEPDAIFPLEYEESEDGEINAADDECKALDVALDSGAITHCANPEDMPGSVEVVVPTDRKIRNFVGAGGDRIKNHGESTVTLEQEDNFAPVSSRFQITDVVRALHSVGEICDGGTKDEHEILFTSGEATVVPAGALSKFIGQVKQQAKYKRKGKGLYVARMYARRPKKAPEKPKPAGFGRQGPKA